MKVIHAVAIICGNCSRGFQRITPIHLEATPDNEEQALEVLREHARARGWRYHEFLEEDHCPKCARQFAGA